MTVIGGLIVSFDATWQLTLVMLAFLPLLIISGMMMKFQLGGQTANSDLITAGQVSFTHAYYFLEFLPSVCLFVLPSFLPSFLSSFLPFFLPSSLKCDRFFQTTEEVLSNIQTVVSLGREEAFFEKYCKDMIIPYK